MGIFYNPPQPPTASTAGTPPEPHVPIGTQGSQPPRYTTALMLVAVLASWPQDLEPRLQKPNNERVKIAPLTLTYGQQPPRVGTSVSTFYETFVGNWPADLEPRLGRPNNIRQTIAPLTLTYGDSPPIVGVAAVNRTSVLGSWPPDLEPRFSWPNSTRVSIAPLTLTYGGQPIPTPPLSTPEFQSITAWPQPDWGTQSAPKSLAWFVPPGTAPYTPYPITLVYNTWPADLEPRLTRPNDRRPTIATLTLPTGTPPQPQPPLAFANLVTIVASWPTTWDAQSSAKNAAWNVPPVLITLPYTPLPKHVWTAWEPAWIHPPKPVVTAPLTLVYGDQPPPSAAVSVPKLTTLIASWPTTWDTQTAGKNAAWNVPPILTQIPYAPTPLAIRAAWEPLWIAPPTPTRIAPLTLVYGTPPVPQAALSTTTFQTILTWAQTWDAQRSPRIVTLTLPTGNQPPVRSPIDRQGFVARAWEPIFKLPQRLLTVIQAFLGTPAVPPVGITDARPLTARDVRGADVRAAFGMGLRTTTDRGIRTVVLPPSRRDIS